ncbi:amino acid ABC transporter substrate-binding protein [Roseateles sp.]|uniref:amino acid ABC transporter substrate-binding protein n=1 Tax=Roseateles sp. TaxID=1971397 RepID=UPI003BA3F648
MLLLACGLILAPHVVHATEAEPTRVVYSAGENAEGYRYDDVREILRLALEKTEPEYGPFVLEKSKVFTNGLRDRRRLEAGEIQVLCYTTSMEMEHNFVPIRIPLRKGLLGYRVALIRKADQGRFAQVQSAEDLRKFTVGQGVGWDDGKVYAGHGIPVMEGQFNNLLKMLDHQRFDLLPRGLGQVQLDLSLYGKELPQVAIEEKLLFHYPWPYYFFFAKSNMALKNRVELGLRKMMKDGSFDAIFWRYNRLAIESLNLKQRRVIELRNPLLPKETPLDDASLWFSPQLK